MEDLLDVITVQARAVLAQQQIPPSILSLTQALLFYRPRPYKASSKPLSASHLSHGRVHNKSTISMAWRLAGLLTQEWRPLRITTKHRWEGERAPKMQTVHTHHEC